MTIGPEVLATGNRIAPLCAHCLPLARGTMERTPVEGFEIRTRRPADRLDSDAVMRLFGAAALQALRIAYTRWHAANPPASGA
jgi:hypothetical protein